MGTKAWHDQPIDWIKPLWQPIWFSKGQSGVLQVTWPFWLLSYQDPSSPMANRWLHWRGRTWPSTEVQYSTASVDRVVFFYSSFCCCKVTFNLFLLLLQGYISFIFSLVTFHLFLLDFYIAINSLNFRLETENCLSWDVIFSLNLGNYHYQKN